VGTVTTTAVIILTGILNRSYDNVIYTHKQEQVLYNKSVV